MFNLLKSDIYRLVRGKAMWALLAVTVLLVAGTVALVWFATTPTFADMVNDQATQNGSTAELSVESDADLTAEEAEALNSKTLDTSTHVLGQTIISSTLLAITASLAAAFALSADFATGFIKNVLAGRRRRRAYFAEKLILVALICALFTLVASGASLLFYHLAGFTYAQAEPVGSVALYLLLVWINTTAYAWIASCATWITRSVTGGSLCAAFVSSTILENGMLFVCMSLGMAIPLLGQVPNFMLANNVSILGEGVGGFTDNAALLWPAIGAPGQIAIVVAIWLALCAAAAFALSHRKDV